MEDYSEFVQWLKNKVTYADVIQVTLPAELKPVVLEAFNPFMSKTFLLGTKEEKWMIWGASLYFHGNDQKIEIEKKNGSCDYDWIPTRFMPMRPTDMSVEKCKEIFYHVINHKHSTGKNLLAFPPRMMRGMSRLCDEHKTGPTMMRNQFKINFLKEDCDHACVGSDRNLAVLEIPFPVIKKKAFTGPLTMPVYICGNNWTISVVRRLITKDGTETSSRINQLKRTIEFSAKTESPEIRYAMYEMFGYAWQFEIGTKSFTPAQVSAMIRNLDKRNGNDWPKKVIKFFHREKGKLNAKTNAS